ncbi:MAG: metalloregulator ArsR/SmtB family transcription factor [Candidatus Riflebacteria bacterium]|nr:metalloregulator ArsR/SmtB family transcription factor [Candidatus Riflebacteria bacterium]
MADPSRLVILQSLLEGPRCVEELAGRLALAASTVSFHLKKLEKAGLVSRTRAQYYAVYAVRTDDLDWTLRDLLSFEDPERKARAARAARMREQVRRAFLRGGRLVQMPVQQQKRRILLEEMAAVFPAGVPIPEKEVDALLHRFHEDHCLLRRLLVDEGFLGRAAGTYWLIPRTGSPGHGVPAGPMMPGAPPATKIPRPSPGCESGDSDTDTGGREGMAEVEATGLVSGGRPGRQEVGRASSPRSSRVPDASARSGRRKEATDMDRKRALKQAYREMVIPAGVFQIRNLRNGRILLGGSMNLNAAFNKHRLQLNWGKHRNAALQKDWNECGESAFEFTILETITPPEDGRQITQDDVRDREKHWLKELQPYGDKGYHER